MGCGFLKGTLKEICTGPENTSTTL